MNYGKLAMLHRIAGNVPIQVYTAADPDQLQKCYDYLQELCNHSCDLNLTRDAIITQNPFLAYHLQELLKKQTVVPPDGTSGASRTPACEIL